MSLNIPNLDKLIAHLEAQPPERINMAWAFFRKTRLYGECGCILAHADEVFPGKAPSYIFGDAPLTTTLFMPPDYDDEDRLLQKRYPAHRVIATLKRLRDRFLATGEIVVDWGPEPTAGEPWSAPRAVEITPPALPKTLTRLLAADRASANRSPDAMTHPHTPDAASDTDRVTLSDIHAANIARQAEWCPDQVPDLSFRGNELGGECGEAQNVIKKLERERLGWRGSRATVEQLAEELADVVICADLCAVTAGINLAAAVVAKFNATSEKVGLTTKLVGPAADTVTDTYRAALEQVAAERVREFFGEDYVLPGESPGWHEHPTAAAKIAIAALTAGAEQ